MSKVIEFDPSITYNVDTGDGFLCKVCQRYTPMPEVTWAYVEEVDGNRTFMHGCEPFEYCPSCGRSIVSMQTWLMYGRHE